MKKKIVIFICIIIGITGANFSTAFAESSIKTKVALCCNGVDYIYGVFNVTNILDVTVSNTNYTSEWEFDQSKSRFYDTPGYWNGSKCLNCGIIIEKPREIPP